jgi:ATP-dependent DNA helicase PIF1
LHELVETGHGSAAWKKILRTDVLVIDEVSMLENHQLERLSAVMKAARKGLERSDQPFGGVQVVVTGDVRAHCPSSFVGDNS